jgi:hypothetical protein
MTQTAVPTAAALLRHFADLRDGNHGEIAVTRAEKEKLFADSVIKLDPYARAVLNEINTALLLDTGEVRGSGLRHTPGGDALASWTLSWPEQVVAGIRPVTIEAFYGRTFHHPHLHGATVGEWPFNVFSDDQAAAEVPTLRAIAAADVHNLVFQRDYRIIPAITTAPVGGRTSPATE